LKSNQRKKQVLLKIEKQKKGCTSGLEEVGIRQSSVFL